MPLKDLSGKRIGKILVLGRNFEKQKEEMYIGTVYVIVAIKW